MDLVIALAMQIFEIEWIEANQITEHPNDGRCRSAQEARELPTHWKVEIGGGDKEGVTHDYTGTGDSLITALQDLVEKLSNVLGDKGE